MAPAASCSAGSSPCSPRRRRSGSIDGNRRPPRARTRGGERPTTEALTGIMRELHTLKGAGGSVNLEEVETPQPPARERVRARARGPAWALPGDLRGRLSDARRDRGERPRRYRSGRRRVTSPRWSPRCTRRPTEPMPAVPRRPGRLGRGRGADLGRGGRGRRHAELGRGHRGGHRGHGCEGGPIHRGTGGPVVRRGRGQCIVAGFVRRAPVSVRRGVLGVRRGALGARRHGRAAEGFGDLYEEATDGDAATQEVGLAGEFELEDEIEVEGEFEAEFEVEGEFEDEVSSRARLRHGPRSTRRRSRPRRTSKSRNRRAPRWRGCRAGGGRGRRRRRSLRGGDDRRGRSRRRPTRPSRTPSTTPRAERRPCAGARGLRDREPRERVKTINRRLMALERGPDTASRAGAVWSRSSSASFTR